MKGHRLLAVAVLCFSFGFTVHAQAAAPDLSDLAILPVHALPTTVVAKAISNVVESKSQPYVYAVNIALPLNLDGGLWTRRGEMWTWRTRIQSAGAQTLSVAFSQLQLPPGAELRLYDAAGQIVQGPYTSADETADGRFWTPLISGGDAVIEATVPTEQRKALQLRLAQVSHGYRGFGKADSSISPKATSGSCEIDVACSAGDAWRTNESRAVARLTLDMGATQGLCSGTLLNSAPQDDRPLFLTAHHCEVTNSNAASVTLYWNYQKPACNSGTGSLANATVGSGNSVVADNATADATLISLGSKPNSTYNVYYAGWNATTSPPTSGAVMHHPQGDVKKIAIYNTPATAQQAQLQGGGLGGLLGGSQTIQTWSLSYSQGVTEPGSSGSGLWNQSHQIVGQLSGGNSSCSAQNANDLYGRFELAYNSSNSPFKAALDPNNTGITSLAGKNQSAAPSTPPPSVPSSSGSGSSSSTSTSTAKSSGGGALGLWLLLPLLGFGLFRSKE